MINIVISSFQTFNELLTAGTAITAFSLLVYAFTFNLRDRVARSFAIILICVVGVYVGKTIGSTTSTAPQVEFWLRFQWVGVIFLPAAYLHFSDALLATTGHPSRGIWRLVTRLTYLVSLAFLLALPSSLLVGPLVQNVEPAPHLQRTWLTL
ncbi:MAG: histidine kinase N-terminal 7TM domain-containing protein, partial [Omnitrophica WOR_2 bacterium]